MLECCNHQTIPIVSSKLKDPKGQNRLVTKNQKNQDNLIVKKINFFSQCIQSQFLGEKRDSKFGTSSNWPIIFIVSLKLEHFRNKLNMGQSYPKKNVVTHQQVP